VCDTVADCDPCGFVQFFRLGTHTHHSGATLESSYGFAEIHLIGIRVQSVCQVELHRSKAAAIGMVVAKALREQLESLPTHIICAIWDAIIAPGTCVYMGPSELRDG
jgi:hypothetical protein